MFVAFCGRTSYCVVARAQYKPPHSPADVQIIVQNDTCSRTPNTLEGDSDIMHRAREPSTRNLCVNIISLVPAYRGEHMNMRNEIL